VPKQQHHRLYLKSDQILESVCAPENGQEHPVLDDLAGKTKF
jgi:hypothetical protein